MRYLWEYVIKLRQEKLDLDQVRFIYGESASPYLEVSRQDLNDQEAAAGQVVEINPYLRFNAIFQGFYHPDQTEDQEIKDRLFHLMICFLAEGDVKQGLTRQDYYKRFLLEEALGCCYGPEVKEQVKLFSSAGQDLIAEGLLKLYQGGSSMELLKEMMAALFEEAAVYDKVCREEKLLIYIRQRRTKQLQDQVQLIITLFADMRYQIEVYYWYHFAVFGEELTGILGETALF